MTYTTINAIANAKCQFNAKTAKDFRTTMGKFYTATCNIAQQAIKTSDDMNAVQQMISSNNDDLERIAKGDTAGIPRTAEEIHAENATFEARKDALREKLAEYRAEEKKRYESAEALVSKDLWKAYALYHTDGDRDAYVLALANFLEENGVTAGLVTIDAIIASIGKKNATNRQIMKGTNLRVCYKFAQWRTQFLRELADWLVTEGHISAHKFTYVPMADRKKNK